MIGFVASLVLPTIWIVDSQMGQGAHFPDLPAAVEAAASGDTVVLRAGTYTGVFLSNKELTLRGEGASLTRIVGAFGGVGLMISNTTGPVVLSGLRVLGEPGVHVFQAEVELLDCEVVSRATIALSSATSGLLVNSGGIVRASRCLFFGSSVDSSISLHANVFGGPAVRVTGTAPSLVADQCLLRGGDATGPGPLSQTGGEALLVSGRVRLDRCRLRGGSGNDVGGSGVRTLQGGQLRIAGDATSYVTGGLGPDGVGPAIRNPAGTIHLHVPVAVQGAIDGIVTLQQELPRLQVVGVTRADGSLEASQPVVVTLDGQLPNHLGFVAFGTPSFSPPQAPFASELLVGGAGSSFLVTPLDATGRLQFAYTPAAFGTVLVGVAVHLQGGVVSPTLGSVLTSNLAVHVALP